MRRILAHSSAIEAGLHTFFRGKRAGPAGANGWGDDLLERLETFATGGKLLRGSVLCYSYEIFAGRTPEESVLQAAMALELTHSALLIHDDIMDNDRLRRGRPALHEQYRQTGASAGLPDSERFGSNMALAAGDAGMFLAYELLGRAGQESDSAAFTLYVSQLLRTCLGQMQDVYLEARPRRPSKRELYQLMKSKTAAYTLALPLTMGAALAGQPPVVLRRLEAIGLAAGTIFQIRDDELGALGNPKKTGKPAGSDIREGKKTLLHYYLYTQCTKSERITLDDIFGNSAADDRAVRFVQNLIRDYHVPTLLDRDIRPFRDRALRDIARLPVGPAAQAELGSLVKFCFSRQY